MKKKIIIISILLLLIIGLFFFDRHQYFWGNSIVDYKCLPLDFRPDIRSNYLSGENAVFVFTYNEYEQIGPGYGSDVIGNSTIKKIVCYYYNSTDLVIACKLTNDDLIYIKPINKDGDITFVRVEKQDIDTQNMHYIDCTETHYWKPVHILKEILNIIFRKE